MRHGSDAGRAAAAMGEHFPTIPGAPGIDRGDDALAAEAIGKLGDQLGPRHGGGIDRDLVGAGEQQRARILDRAHPAADGKRHETHLRGAAHHAEDRAARLVAGGDVEEAEFVGAGRDIGAGLLARVAGVLQVDEDGALAAAPVGDVEAGDDAGADGHAAAATASAAARSSRPSYNARPVMTPSTPSRAWSASTWISLMLAPPPEAITGISTARARSTVASMLQPLSRPSRPTSVNSKDATPASSKRRARSITSTSETLAQPCVATMPSRASPATTTPPGKSFAAPRTNSGSSSAALPLTPRDPPRSNQPSPDSRVRLPPPSWTWPGKASRIARTASPLTQLPAKAPSRSTTWRNSAPCSANSVAWCAGMSP